VTYSFYPTKNLGGLGDGGAVVTDDDVLAAQVRLLRNHGAGPDYLHTEIATNARMSELEAAALRVGLTGLRERNDRRRAIALYYRNAAPALGWQESHPRHAMHLCVLRTPDRVTFRERASFETAVHYPHALPQQPAYARFVTNPCPEAEAWAAECVSLPCRPEMSDAEIEFVAEDLARVASAIG
jgi:dTDP-4-amino-4,6-dideoxygalactose transaminase